MIGEGTVFATIAVRDLEAGKNFYSGMLGLETANEIPGGVTYQSGSGKLFVYQSEFAGTNRATAATWEVDDVEGAVAELKEKGMAFEHYDTGSGEWQGDVLVMDDMRVAWFKDPDGNVLCISNTH